MSQLPTLAVAVIKEICIGDYYCNTIWACRITDLKTFLIRMCSTSRVINKPRYKYCQTSNVKSKAKNNLKYMKG